MKKSKLPLNEISITSFETGFQAFPADTVRGGGKVSVSPCPRTGWDQPDCSSPQRCNIIW